MSAMVWEVDFSALSASNCAAMVGRIAVTLRGWELSVFACRRYVDGPSVPETVATICVPSGDQEISAVENS